MTTTSESRARRRVAYAALTIAFLTALVEVGFLVGSRFASRRIARWTSRFERNEFIGQVIGGDLRAGAAACYEDPAAALAMFDRISWAPPPLPTPFVGHAAAPGVSGNAVIGPHQFRDARPLSSKPAGTTRIFITGGSTAYGSGAPAQEPTIAGYLEAALAARAAPGERYEVITAAYPGRTSTHEAEWTGHHIVDFQPDLVVALSGANDVHWSILGIDIRWFRSYADEYFFQLLNEARRAAGLAPYPEVAPGPREAAPEFPPVQPAVVASRLVRNARQAASAVAAVGGRYLFALQPTIACSGKALSARERRHLEAELLAPGVNDYFRRCYDEIRRALPGAGPDVSFVDLSGALDDLPAEREVFIDSYHFGDVGNAKIAERLVEPVLAALARGR